MQIVQVLQSLQDTVGAKSSVSKEQVSMESYEPRTRVNAGGVGVP